MIIFYEEREFLIHGPIRRQVTRKNCALNKIEIEIDTKLQPSWFTCIKFTMVLANSIMRSYDISQL